MAISEAERFRSVLTPSFKIFCTDQKILSFTLCDGEMPPLRVDPGNFSPSL